jgi:chromosome segregation ATPase
MDEAERICGNCGKLARAHCNCSYHDLWNRIAELDAEPSLIRSEEPSRVEMQDEIIRLQADISRLRDIIASLERALDVKHERIKELEGHAAGEDAYHHGYRDGYKAGQGGR